MPLENRLSELIQERGLTMYSIAKRTNLTYQTIFNLAHKKTTRIDLETLSKLCDALDAEPGQIFVWVRANPPESG